MAWRILCDFDGTITRADVVDSLLDRFASRDWLEVEAEWQAGRIGSRECLSRQFDLITASRAQLDAHFDAIATDPAFPAFLAAVGRAGMAISIVSDGIDAAIARILGRVGCLPLDIVANRLVARPGGHWAIEFPHMRGDCRVAAGNCKCACPSSGLRTLVIGDGRSDVCAARRADFVFAKDALADYCAANAVPHCRFESFVDLPPYLGMLTAGAARPAPSVPERALAFPA